MSMIPSDEEHRTSPLSAPHPKGRHSVVILVFAIAAVLVGVLWWVNHRQRPGAQAGAGGPGRGRFAGGGALPVMARTARSGDINVYLDGLGTVTPLANVTVRAELTGQLMQIAFKEGQMVNQGDLLAVIDPRPYEVALQQYEGQLVQAQAQLKEAQIDLARYETLSLQDSIATQTVDQQRAMVSQFEGLVQADQAQIASAKLNLVYCHVVAPVTGRVGLTQVEGAGNYVTPGDANGLVVLTQLKPITVIFTLPEDNIPDVVARLHAGASIPVDAYDRSDSRKLASGTLSTIDNEVDPTTGTVKLRAQFPNDDESLFPNQFVNVRMLLNVDHGAIVIPTSAIEHGQDGTFVYVIKADNTVTARPVTLGSTEGERVEVAKGLAEGERVVVDGADRLKEGARWRSKGRRVPVMAEPAASPPGNTASARAAAATAAHSREPLPHLHTPAGRDDAADGGDPDRRFRGVRVPAPVGAARGGLSDDPDADVLSRRQSRCHHLGGYRAAGAPAWGNARFEADVVNELRGGLRDHAAIHPGPGHGHRGAGGAGGDQRGHQLSAHRSARSADLCEGESGGRSRPLPGAHLEDAPPDRSRGPGRHPGRAKNLPIARRGPGEHRRRPAAIHARAR